MLATTNTLEVSLARERKVCAVGLYTVYDLSTVYTNVSFMPSGLQR